MTRVHFLTHQIYHDQSSSNDSSDLLSISSDQSDIEGPEESNYDANYINERQFFEDSDSEEDFGHLGNSETIPLKNTEDVDIFG